VLVDEPASKRPLSHDPNFVAGTNDLDRDPGEGLANDYPFDPNNFPFVAPLGPTSRLASRTVPAQLPDHANAPFPSAPPAAWEEAPPPTASRLRRPLLDLFPPEDEPFESAPASVAPSGAEPSLTRVPAEWIAPGAATRLDAPASTESIESITYERFYGLADKPFSLSTDPKFLYHSTAHDRTAQALLTSIGTREGLVVITGQAGIGKTSLCRAVMEELDRRTLTSFLVDPFLTVEDLLQTLLIDFGVVSRDELTADPHPSAQQMRVTLQSFLASLEPLGASAVVLVDEAQNLPVAVLDELRSLAEIGGDHRLLHVVLVGSPALLTLLKREDLRSLNAKVTVRSVLGPLEADEMSAYVRHRLSVAGNATCVDFGDEALAQVHQLTRGVPRTVNQLCDRAMTLAYEASAAVIDVALVDGAAADLGLLPTVVETSSTRRLMLAAVAFILLMLLGAGAALWVFRDAVRRTVVQWQQAPQPPAAPRSR